MNPLTWVKLQVEAAKFGIKMGKELMEENPLMQANEAKVRIAVAWCDHLKETGRSNLIKKPEMVAKMRSLVEHIDAKRYEHVVRAVAGQFIN